jgi:hypothetical protein
MPTQVAVTIIDEVPGRGRQVAFKLELWSERVTAGLTSTGRIDVSATIAAQ